MTVESNLTNDNGFNVLDHLRHLSLYELIELQAQSSCGLHVAMYNVVRDFNLASVVRNAVVFGCAAVHIIGWRKFDKRGAVGAHHYVPLVFHENVDAFFSFCTDNNLRTVALEYSDRHESIDVNAYTWHSDTVILIGEEGRGIPDEDLDQCQDIVHIPQYGILRSLNAAVASGIALNSYRHNLITDF